MLRQGSYAASGRGNAAPDGTHIWRGTPPTPKFSAKEFSNYRRQKYSADSGLVRQLNFLLSDTAWAARSGYWSS